MTRTDTERHAAIQTDTQTETDIDRQARPSDTHAGVQGVQGVVLRGERCAGELARGRHHRARYCTPPVLLPFPYALPGTALSTMPPMRLRISYT
eukprot:2390987-Rhodomonas_salina.1